MGKARTVPLETRFFSKHGDAYAFFKEMLHRYPLGGMVLGTDKADLRALLRRHEEETEKIGSGISHFIVDDAPPEYEIRTRCFWIIRSDGSRTDFSFKHCLEARPGDTDSRP